MSLEFEGFLWELLTASDTYELLWSSINETQSLPSLTGVSESELLILRTSSRDKRVRVKRLGPLVHSLICKEKHIISAKKGTNLLNTC